MGVNDATVRPLDGALKFSRNFVLRAILNRDNCFSRYFDLEKRLYWKFLVCMAVRIRNLFVGILSKYIKYFH